MKIPALKAGELFNKATSNLAKARSRLLRMCGAQDHDLPTRVVRYCGHARHRVSGATLTYDGEVFDILNTFRAKAGDEEGDPALVCYRVAQAQTRRSEMLVFLAV